MQRVVAPEILDSLPPDDPRAIGSRTDLQRLNRIMNHARLLARLLEPHLKHLSASDAPLRLVELGAGDGTLLLELARRWFPRIVRVNAILLDRQPSVSDETRRAFAALGWNIESLAVDVLGWLQQPGPPVDVMLANLFLHHFPEAELRTLLHLAAGRTTHFVACEPRRSRWPLTAAHLLWGIGCNAVTRHDATVSVRAGFAGAELTALWPEDSSWRLREQPVGIFSHGFLAVRNE